MQVIITPFESTIAVLYPHNFDGLTVEEIAKKFTPTNIPYLVIDSSELTADREFREAWEADFTNPDGYGGL